jgi:hypothetical protein
MRLRQLVASAAEVQSIWNIGPSWVIGAWWLLIGVTAGAYIALHGRLGFASLAVSLYWLLYYLLFPRLDLPTRAPPQKLPAPGVGRRLSGPFGLLRERRGNVPCTSWRRM